MSSQFFCKDTRGQGRLVEDKTKEHIHTTSKLLACIQLLDDIREKKRGTMTNVKPLYRGFQSASSALPYKRPKAVCHGWLFD